MNTMLSTLDMLIQTHKLPSWDIITRNQSPRVEIISAKSLNMVQVLRYIGPMTGWSYNLRTVPIYSRIFIPVLISYFYLIIPTVMIE